NQVPLQGATVSVKGTNVQTSTDDSGVFTLSTPADTFTLAVSYIGFLTREFPVNTLLEGEIVIELEPAQDETLDEVVVVGYGTQRKRDITGAVSSVNAQAISEVPVTQASQALQGRAAGILVTNTSNKPGGGATVRIRGNRSFSAGNDPLYVIDGIPITGGL